MASVIDENTQFIDPITSTPIVNGYIYIGANGLDAKLNPITIYSDRDLNPATPLSNPQRTDSSGRSVNKIWVPGRYSMKITDSADVQKLNDLDLGELADTGTTLLTNVQGSDTITAEGSPTITTLTDGQLYVFTTILANTGPVTLQADATPAYPIKKNHDIDLAANELEANQMIVAAWNSTDSVYELQGYTARDRVVLDADGDTTITADTDNQIDFRLGGTDIHTMKTVASAVNGIDFTGAATGNNPIIRSSGEADTGLILADSNSNEVAILESVAAAVNELTITNSATGNAVVISATGSDPDIDITLTPKGTGVVNLPTKPSFSVHRNGTNQSSMGTGDTKIQWTTAEFDTTSDWDLTTNYRYTPSVAGKYLLSAAAYILSSAGHVLRIAIYKNGTLYKAFEDTSQGTNFTFVSVTAVADANGSTDYFEVFAANTSASNPLVGSADESYFSGCKID